MRRNRDLFLLVVGQFFSALGDHFYLVAMPWLALEVTGSAFVAGTVLASASLPRSALMLLGGTIADRRSPKTLLILSNGLQAVVMGVLALALQLSYVELWFLYGLAFLTGTLDAFGLPAFNSVLPNIVDPDELESGNIYLQGANMASGAIGPALAGLLIFGASSSGQAGEAPLQGLSIAFLANALTFMVGISFFWWIRFRSAAFEAGQEHASILNSLRYVLGYIRKDRPLRTILGTTFLVSLILTGSIRIGFPLLAEQIPDGGVRMFGYMSSAFGAGLLAGMAALRILPRGPSHLSGMLILGLFAVVPLGLIMLGLGPGIPFMLSGILLMGAAFGYVLIYLLSWLQRRTPRAMIGRVMAVILFATIGMSPVSQALMGFLLEISLRWTFIASGCVTLAILLLLGSSREMRQLSDAAEARAPEISPGAART